MIKSFGNKLAEDLYDDKQIKEVRKFSQKLHRVARRKLLYLHDASPITDLRVPPGNRLEALNGDWAGYHSIRINSQWRLVFIWKAGHAESVHVLDYH